MSIAMRFTRKKDHHDVPPVFEPARASGGTGYETPAAMSTTAIGDGRAYGQVRTPREQALGPDADPVKFQQHSGEARCGYAKQAHARQEGAAGERVATGPARKARAKALLATLQGRLKHLRDHDRPAAQDAVMRCRAAVDRAKDHYQRLPQLHRGYFDRHVIVPLVGIGVVLFDAGVLHGALETSGMSLTSVWITTISVPLAIGAANHAFGMAAGAVVLRIPGEHRLKAALLWFVTGLGALLLTFVLLTLFRSQAAASQNAALQALARGDEHASLTFFVSPMWMGPLQIAGSFAAMTMTALWTAAKPGRDHLALVVAPAEDDLRAALRKLEGVDAQIAEITAQSDAATLLPHEVDADVASAEVEVKTLAKGLAAELETEEAHAEAMKDRYQTVTQHTHRLYANGGIWRMAMATVFPRLGRPYTPGATDVPADEQVIAERHARTVPRRGRFDRGADERDRPQHDQTTVDPDGIPTL